MADPVTVRDLLRQSIEAEMTLREERRTMKAAFTYKGYTLNLTHGSISHQVSPSPDTEGAMIDLSMAATNDNGMVMSLTVDEAQKLGVALLRDVSLIRFGAE